MEFISPLLISFILIFLSELGDKTQLLVLSFSTKLKTFTILLGVAIGSFLSHGIAILFGSFINNIEIFHFHNILQITTYILFIILGIFVIFSKKNETTHKSTFLNKISNLKLNYILIIAITIAVGEIGDKTFLASLGLGIQYSNYKLFLIIGSILGMIVSDYLIICIGKFLSNYINNNIMQIISGILFILFGLLGFFFLK